MGGKSHMLHSCALGGLPQRRHGVHLSVYLPKAGPRLDRGLIFRSYPSELRVALAQLPDLVTSA